MTWLFASHSRTRVIERLWTRSRFEDRHKVPSCDVVRPFWHELARGPILTLGTIKRMVYRGELKSISLGTSHLFKCADVEALKRKRGYA